MTSKIIIISEFSRSAGAPSGLLASDLFDRLCSYEDFDCTLLCMPNRYRPGGLNMMRLFNLLALHILTPLCIFLWRMSALLKGQSIAVVAITSPPLIHWTAQLSGFFFRVPVVTWYQDAHPEIEARIFEKKGLRIVSQVLRWLDRHLMRLPRLTVTLDEAMRALLFHIRGNFSETISLPPWATYMEPPMAIRAPSLTGNFHVLYAGNYGTAHDMSNLTSRLSSLSESALARVKFTFVGMNSQSAQKIQQLFSGIAVETQFLPRFKNISGLLGLMHSIDFGLVSLHPEFSGIMCPSKAFTYLSQGAPVLYAGPDKSLCEELCAQGWGVSSEDFLRTLEEKAPLPTLNINQIFPNPKVVALEELSSALHRIVTKPVH